ncbi:MAG: flavin reductase family protein, partial [Chloroflexota bacterium]
IDPDHFKEVMRHWAAGVSVVTSRHGDEIHGCTANSFTSVSLTPPLVAISLAKVTHTFQMIMQSQIFAVNILSIHQQATSARFASSIHDAAARFADEPFRSEATGAPILAQAIAFADCRLFSTHDVGLNVILIGLVEAGRVQHLQPPLIYSNRQYWKLAK